MMAVPGFLFTIVPRRLFTALLGWFASLENPRSFVRVVIYVYARIFRVDLSEAERLPEDYASLQDFFTRKLRSGVRSIGEGVVSPVDGTIAAFGTTAPEEEGLNLLVVKGEDYEFSELFPGFSSQSGESFEAQQARWAHFYLSPRDYHWVHAPCDMQITSIHYLPGEFYPVAPWAAIRQVLQRNERVSILFRMTDKKGQEFLGELVMIAAIGVGNLRLSFADLPKGKKAGERYVEHFAEPVQVPKGKELGVFALGSSVVMAFSDIESQFSKDLTQGQDIRLGAPLGL